MAVSVRSRTGRQAGLGTDARHGRTDVAAPGGATSTDGERRGRGAASADGAGSQRDRIEERIAQRLRRTIGDDQYDRHFSGRAAWVVTDREVEVKVASRFLAGFLDRRFGAALASAVEDVTGGQGLCVRFTVDRTPDPEAAVSASGQEATDADAPAFVSNGDQNGSRVAATLPAPAPTIKRTPASDAVADDERYALERFVVGPANELAYHAALELVEGARSQGLGSLFVHGACGMGKTHLIRGAARRFRERHPGARIKCTTGEAFTRTFVAAVRKGEMDRFRRALRGVDLLCIDDVHFLANKEATQEELLHTFDAIDLSGARVMLASDEHPRQIRKFNRALVSRFLSGLVTRVDPPDLTMRQRLVAELARRRGLVIEQGAARSVAVRMDGAGHRPASVREIEGVLTRLEAVSRLLPEFGGNGAIGQLAVERALGSDADEAVSGGSRGASGTTRPVDLRTLIDAACEVLSVDVGEVLGRGRHPRVVLARSVVSLLARRATTMSFPEIARGLGRASHSTVVAACRRMETRLDQPEGELITLGREGLTLGEVFERVARRSGASWAG